MIKTFTLTWNNSNLRIAIPERNKKRTCAGVEFANGLVALENGAVYEHLEVLKVVLAQNGKYTITWHNRRQHEQAAS